jgi:hypothetical protein
MKAYETEAQLNQLIGQKINVDGKSGKVIRWHVTDTTLKIVMDTQDLVVLSSDIPDFLTRIRPQGEMVIHQPPNSTIIHAVGTELSNIIMDNIRKVKADKEYIPQAQEINANVKSMIDLAKAEVEYMKTIAYLHKNG